MVWIVAAVGILVVVVALVALVGSVLPKGHVVTRMAHFNRPPTEIWQVITDFAGQVSWRSDLRRVERLPNIEGREVWQETLGRGQSITFESMESVPRRRLVRRIADEHLPFGGTWTMEVAEYGEVSSLMITEDGEVKNPFFRFISRFIIGQTATIDGYLKALGEKLGVEVNITSV